MPSLGAWGITQARVQKYFRSYRGWRTPGIHGPHNQLSIAHMVSQRLKSKQMDLHGVGIYGMGLSFVFLRDTCGSRCIFESFSCSWEFFSVGSPYPASGWELCLLLLYLVLSYLLVVSWRLVHLWRGNRKRMVPRKRREVVGSCVEWME